ncbi:glycerol-3-phosphate transporter subunit; ATP-binding component of ABC superfamily [Vibrio tapetis subsp. tapetis]|uniref:Glycerol-3-phosphate transporter subunit ATP-binding component of ABC superfamily n=1 Tax=Vibrio tapetis subsp. tapetis TaxID=1671868 RepID=A0A2N8ZKC8_9VIBR|nr:glycerol-3-phosphate transporter subunit; ATP-binding component of ABC superfamily [Vibrio tapetis subsp. tapetis]
MKNNAIKDKQNNVTHMNNASSQKDRTMLDIRSLIKTYENGHQAVKGVSLNIKKGEFIVLVGPSGCGKSSILRSIAGLESISGGEIHLGGRRVDTEKPALRDIAMVFQNYALYPHMSVYDNLAYGLKNRNVNKQDIKAKIESVAKTLKIEDYLDRKPSKLSGGQRQRVAMGRAIVRDPQLFLFDEPLSNLDASLRAHMRLEIRKLQRKLGVTSVYVTHDQVEAMTLADRIVVLNQGEIEQVGTPAEVYHQPASTFVASFIGSPAMNFIPAKLDKGNLEVAGQLFHLPHYSHLDTCNVSLGIRPEHAEIATADAATQTVVKLETTLTVSLDISVVEPLGPNQLVHGNVDGSAFIAVTPEVELNQAQPLTLSIAQSNLHIFDQHGKRLTTRHQHAKAHNQATA